MKLALVTGCRGFIGSHFTKHLLNNGWFVYGVDLKNFSLETQDFDSCINFKQIGYDICDLKELPDCDYVFNFAAETHVHNSIEDSEPFIHSNISGVRNILELIRKKQDNVAKRPVLVQVSSDEVFGDREIPALESDPLNPSSPYSASKAAADMLVLAWARTYGIEYIIVRPTNNYGTNQHPEKLIPLTIKLALWGKEIRLHNAGVPKRIWCHVEDTVSAIMKIVEKNVRGIFNISGNLEQTNLVTVSKVLMEMGIKPDDYNLNLNYTRPGQDMRYMVDDSKLRQLGWKPNKHFDDEIKKIVKFYLENPEERLYKV